MRTFLERMKYTFVFFKKKRYESETPSPLLSYIDRSTKPCTCSHHPSALARRCAGLHHQYMHFIISARPIGGVNEGEGEKKRKKKKKKDGRRAEKKNCKKGSPLRVSIPRLIG